MDTASRSADDAAGLAISRRCAGRFADWIKLLRISVTASVLFKQVRVHYRKCILFCTMKELSVQAANDTNSKTDVVINAEISELKQATKDIFRDTHSTQNTSFVLLMHRILTGRQQITFFNIGDGKTQVVLKSIITVHMG